MARSGWGCWGIAFLLGCLVCGPVFWASRWAASRPTEARPTPETVPAVTLWVTPTTPPRTPTRTPVLEVTPAPGPLHPGDAVSPEARQNLEVLQSARLPVHDPIAFTEAVLGRPVQWATPTPGPPRRVGERETFYVMDMETHQAYTITAKLVYVTPHAYFWVEEGVPYDLDDVRALMQAFEDRIYPTTRRLFGSEWVPGIDGDPRVYILYVRRLGGGVAGYYASSDEWPPAVHPYSNRHEMFVFSASSSALDDPWTQGLLAHEFQHMIHWYQDRNEASWLNEGASELAMLLNGYEPGSGEVLYLNQPDVQLNAWPDPQQASTLPHYQAAFLFLLYFWERFGDDALRDLIAHDANGWDGVQAILDRYAPGLTYEEVFLDWLVANLVQDPTLEDGRYGYRTYTLSDRPRAETLDECPGSWKTQVFPFGMDLYRLTCPGTWTLRLEGEAQVALWPTEPHSGAFAFWSNYGDESEMRLTRRFDLRGVQGPVTLSYWTWYDIEPNYDFVYLLASRDGKRWDMLRPPSATDANPTGNNYGWGYTGVSGGGETPRWIREEVDLSAYAGGEVWVRFVYVTDAAVNRVGFLVDDVTLEALGYREDFEDGEGGWEAEGFVRVSNRLPAEFRWMLVYLGPGATRVERLPVEGGHRGLVTVNIPEEGKTYLLVTLVTRYTRQPGVYRLEIQAP